MSIKLYPFQAEDYKIIVNRFNLRAYVGFEPGLGKTVISIKAVLDHVTGPTLVVAPAGAKVHWSREFAAHVGKRADILGGRKPAPLSGKGSPVYVINYENLWAWKEVMRELRPEMVIIDEAQRIKDPNAKCSRAAKEICRLAHVPKIMMLSGTPMPNRPIELWFPVSILRPDLFPSMIDYGKIYCAGVKRFGYWDFSGSSNEKELNTILINECFPADVSVQCRHGRVPIGELVEKQLNVEVLSYDHETAQVCWRKVVAHAKRERPSRLIRIVHESGELICTPNHPIWGEDKYHRAEAIVPGFPLSVLPQAENGQVPEQHDLRKVLLDKMCREGAGVGRSCNKEGLPEKMGPVATRYAKVPVVPSQIQAGGKTGPLLLLPLPSTKSGAEAEGQKGQASPDRDEEVFPLSQHHTKVRQEILPNGTGMERDQVLLQQVRIQGQMGSNTKSQEVATIHQNILGSREVAIRFGMEGQQDRSPNPNSEGGRNLSERQTLRGLGRPCLQGSETSNRGGRANPQTSTPAGARQMEGASAKTSRVVSVEVLQQGDRHWPNESGQEDSVYDIEVEGTHNFFAEGVLVHNCMVRRKKVDVLAQLPSLTSVVMPFDLKPADRREYDKARGNFLDWLATKDKKKARNAIGQEEVTKLGYLLRLAAMLKVPDVVAWVKEFLESGEKLILFCHHHDFVDAVHEKFEDVSLVVTGDTPMRLRQTIFDRFNDDPSVKLLIGNIQAAGVFWSCRSTSTVAFGELDWVPGNIVQAIDRVRGIKRGTGKPVTAYYLTAANTIEDKLCEVLERKTAVLDAVIDGKKSGDLELFTYLIEALKREGRPAPIRAKKKEPSPPKKGKLPWPLKKRSPLLKGGKSATARRRPFPTRKRSPWPRRK